MRKRHKISLIIVLALISLGSAAAWFGAAAFYGAHLYFTPRLPSVEVLKDVRMQQPLRIYSADGMLIAEYGEKRRIPLAIDRIPEKVKQAFIAAEDDRFHEHPGVDYRGLIRAAVNQALTGDRSQGGSTITMQVARNFFLTREKTYLRKINEIFLALQIERELPKDKILELYLNKIYLGKRAYGVAAAAQVYYGRTLDELDLAEIAMIAGLPKAPSTYNPIANPGRALQRRGYVLGRMHELGYITDGEYEQASAAPLTAGAREVAVEAEAPYLAEMVRADILERYGEEAYTSGLKVYTTIDTRLQKAANRAIRNGLLAYTRRHGWRGPIRRLELPDGVETVEIRPEDSPADGLRGLVDEPAPAEGIIERAGAPESGTAESGAGDGTVHQLSQTEAELLIEGPGRFVDLRPALVLAIGELVTPEAGEDGEEPEPVQSARLYLGKGEYGELSLASARWAAPYITVNSTGDEPDSLDDVLAVGDLVWVRPAGAEPGEAEEGGTPAEPETGETSAGRWRLSQLPQAEGALVSLNPENGAVVSLVGGFDYFKSKFNRAAQARRQPGSGFKPYIYSAALENGFTAASIINDAPVVFDDPALEGKWKPENYSGRFYGPTRLREGLVHSRNLVSIRLLIELGIVKARNYARRFGFPDEALPRDLSLALGSGNVTPLEMSRGFAVFSNGGFYVEPFYIDRIEDADGNVLWLADYELACLECFLEETDPEVLERDYIVDYALLETLETESDTPAGTGAATGEELPAAGEGGEESEAELPRRRVSQARRVMEPRVNYIMNSMLRDVVKRGTGRRALALGRNDLAGKTGTSDDEHDAWFNGFNGKYVASVWVGFDNPQPLGRREPGGRAALPVWIDFMRTALDGVPEQLPKQPDGIVSIRIDARTGLLASGASGESLFELFREEKVPTRKASTTDYGPGGSENGGEPGNGVTEELF